LKNVYIKKATDYQSTYAKSTVTNGFL